VLGLTGPPRFCQDGLIRPVTIWTWYGGWPPVQLRTRLLFWPELVETRSGAVTDAMFIAAALAHPFLSARLTVNTLAPMSATAEVQERVPFGETISHAGLVKWLLDTKTLSEPTKSRPSPDLLEWLTANEADSALSSITLGEMVLGIERLACQDRCGIPRSISGRGFRTLSQVLLGVCLCQGARESLQRITLKRLET